MSRIFGWNLNFYDRSQDEFDELAKPDWYVGAYADGSAYGKYVILDLLPEEAEQLKLYDDSNEYDSGPDFWIDCDWFIQNYPHDIPERILDWLENLPLDDTDPRLS